MSSGENAFYATMWQMLLLLDWKVTSIFWSILTLLKTALEMICHSIVYHKLLIWLVPNFKEQMHPYSYVSTLKNSTVNVRLFTIWRNEIQVLLVCYLYYLYSALSTNSRWRLYHVWWKENLFAKCCWCYTGLRAGSAFVTHSVLLGRTDRSNAARK